MKKALVVTLLLAAIVVVIPALAADEPAALPDGFKGFRGLLKGTISSKTENSFVLKVTEVVKTFPKNEATKPENAVGKELTIQVKADRLQKILKELKAEDVVVSGVFNVEGNVLNAVEDLRKADAPVASPAPAGSEEVAKLRARLADLEKAVAALKAENEALRKQLAEAKAKAATP